MKHLLFLSPIIVFIDYIYLKFMNDLSMCLDTLDGNNCHIDCKYLID